MQKFKVKVTTPEAYDGEYAHIIVEAVRTGRRWITQQVEEYGNACERAMIINEMVNDGEKLLKCDWHEMDRDGNVIYYA